MGEKPGGLQSIGLHRGRHDLVTEQQQPLLELLPLINTLSNDGFRDPSNESPHFSITFIVSFGNPVAT